MKFWLILALALLVVSGEKPKNQSRQTRKETANPAHGANDAPSGTIIVVNQQEPQGQENNHPAKSPSYLCRLFSPENLPNIALVIVAAITAWYVARQAKETAKSTAVMRQNIALQFKPKVVVRRSELEFGSLEIGGKPAKIHCTVANIGGTEGRITKLQGAFTYWNAPGFWGNPSRGNRISPDAYSQRIDMQLSVNLRSSEDQTLTIEADQTMFDKVKFVQMRSGHNVTNPSLVGEIRICAEIHYIDGEKITRKTGIYRRLDIETMRFQPIDDKEYEYQD